MPHSILVADLDRHASEALRHMLEREGAKVRVACDPSELLALDIASAFTIIFADSCFPEIDNARALDYLRVRAPEAFLVATMARPDELEAETLRKMGADMTLAKPYAHEAVRQAIGKADESARGKEYDFAGMIGRSAPMLALYDTITSIARTDSSALIYGETGAGKELIASAIHKLSRRRHKKFVTINCGALSESLLESELFGHEKGAFTGAIRAKAGKFETGDGGTVFLDEIGEISPNVQLKLLKVIETGEVERLGSNRVIKTDARLLFATNRDLSEDVKNGRFRQDLYYRINVFPIRAPSLRERKEDIPALASHFLGVYAARHGKDVTAIEPTAINFLMDMEWKGNVRELENVMERAVIVCRGKTVAKADLAPGFDEAAQGLEIGGLSHLTYADMRRKVMSVYERRYLTQLLAGLNGNVSLAAQRAGLDRKTMYNKLAEHGIDPSDYRKRRDG